jgi:ankyrin repeat protein
VVGAGEPVSPRLLAALFEHGSDRDPRGHDGGTLLHFAALCEPGPGRDIFGVFDFLLQAGIDESVRNDFGDTAMDICRAKLLKRSLRAYEAAQAAHMARHLSSQLPGAGKMEGEGRRRL